MMGRAAAIKNEKKTKKKIKKEEEEPRPPSYAELQETVEIVTLVNSGPKGPRLRKYTPEKVRKLGNRLSASDFLSCQSVSVVDYDFNTIFRCRGCRRLQMGSSVPRHIKECPALPILHKYVQDPYQLHIQKEGFTFWKEKPPVPPPDIFEDDLEKVYSSRCFDLRKFKIERYDEYEKYHEPEVDDAEPDPPCYRAIKQEDEDDDHGGADFGYDDTEGDLDAKPPAIEDDQDTKPPANDGTKKQADAPPVARKPAPLANVSDSSPSIGGNPSGSIVSDDSKPSAVDADPTNDVDSPITADSVASAAKGRAQSSKTTFRDLKGSVNQNLTGPELDDNLTGPDCPVGLEHRMWFRPYPRPFYVTDNNAWDYHHGRIEAKLLKRLLEGETKPFDPPDFIFDPDNYWQSNTGDIVRQEGLGPVKKPKDWDKKKDRARHAASIQFPVSIGATVKKEEEVDQAESTGGGSDTTQATSNLSPKSNTDTAQDTSTDGGSDTTQATSNRSPKSNTDTAQDTSTDGGSDTGGGSNTTQATESGQKEALEEGATQGRRKRNARSTATNSPQKSNTASPKRQKTTGTCGFLLWTRLFSHAFV